MSTHLVCLSDNSGCVLAADRSRSRDFKMLVQLREMSALLFLHNPLPTVHLRLIRTWLCPSVVLPSRLSEFDFLDNLIHIVCPMPRGRQAALAAPSTLGTTRVSTARWLSTLEKNSASAPTIFKELTRRRRVSAPPDLTEPCGVGTTWKGEHSDWTTSSEAREPPLCSGTQKATFRVRRAKDRRRQHLEQLEHPLRQEGSFIETQSFTGRKRELRSVAIHYFLDTAFCTYMYSMHFKGDQASGGEVRLAALVNSLPKFSRRETRRAHSRSASPQHLP